MYVLFVRVLAWLSVVVKTDLLINPQKGIGRMSIRRPMLTALTLGAIVGLTGPTYTRAQSIEPLIADEVFLAGLDPRWDLYPLEENSSTVLTFAYKGIQYSSMIFYMRRAFNHGYALATIGTSATSSLYLYPFVFLIHDSGQLWVGRFGSYLSFESMHTTLQAAVCLDHKEGDYCNTAGSGKVVAYDGTLPFSLEKKPKGTYPTSWGAIKASIAKP